ncbi:MAG: hypothetical protein JWM68_4655 [Verrucomicrobiales bacterium]|nr:hypothetical protein [Verrucomicrobiales bacterium]
MLEDISRGAGERSPDRRLDIETTATALLDREKVEGSQSWAPVAGSGSGT